jgi:hypothetical protein
MKKKLLAQAALLAMLGSPPGMASAQSPLADAQALIAGAQNLLTGDTRLACEAILCLASAVRPTECAVSIAHFFSLAVRDPIETITRRLNFLRLCPASGETPGMQSLVSAIANGAGRCDAGSLNNIVSQGGSREDGTYYRYISNQMPTHCNTYIHHAYTDLSSAEPRYVGTPARGGYWVDAQNYDSALAAYNERIQREDEAGRSNWTTSSPY